jgi:ureidoglycolate lyase
MRRVPLEPLTRDAFAPFGDVVTAGAGPGRDTNRGTAVRFDWTSAILNARAGAKPNLAVFRSLPQALPFRVTVLERHPFSTQVFAPMLVSRWLVIVTPDGPDGAPAPGGLRAFVAGAGQAVNFRVGVWHHPVIVLDQPAELLMLAHEDGTAGDCEEHPLAQPVEIG